MKGVRTVDEARLIRRVRFRASHRYVVPGRSEEESGRRFGAQALPHEHDWTVEARVRGPIDADTGFVTDLAALDEALEALLGAWADGDLNERVPEVRSGEMSPSTESLARWIFQHLAPAVSPPARLERVAVFESPDLGAEYPA